MTRAPPHFRSDFCESDRRLPARFERSRLTMMGQEARYSVPEKLPDALIALVDQLDDLQDKKLGVICLSAMSRRGDFAFTQDKA